MDKDTEWCIQHRVDLKQQYTRDIASFKYLMFLQYLSEEVLLKTVWRARQYINLLYGYNGFWLHYKTATDKI